MKLIGLTGKSFGRWTVLAMYSQRSRWGDAVWLCRCSCGNERAVRGSNLRTGGSTSCGCTHHINLAGKRFGRWLVLAPHSKRRWHCRCRCGTERIVHGGHLRSGKSKSCGCFSRELHTKHGLSHTRAYQSWQAAMARCFNPQNKSYADYGGRGITAYADWREDFLSFYADMLDPPPGMSLDRIDNDGNYEPGNCRWATPLVQAGNRRPRRRSRRKRNNGRAA